MLNSQPLGFYSASQLVQDAKRHGVEVRRVDVMTASGTARWKACRTRRRCGSGCAWWRD
jgi:DNA polymerase III alpha subunit